MIIANKMLFYLLKEHHISRLQPLFTTYDINYLQDVA